MNKPSWTDAAKLHLDQYIEDHAQTWNKTGANAQDIKEDLRSHIEEKAIEYGMPNITKDNVEQVLRNWSVLDSSVTETDKELMSQDAFQTKKDKTFSFNNLFIYIFGIALPIIAVIVELSTSICSEVLFDPLPTIPHVLIYLLIPVSNIISIRACTKGKTNNWINWLNVMAFGVSVFYGLIFLPLLPLGIIGILFLGIGLCGLSPLLGLISLWTLNKRLRSIATSKTENVYPSKIKGLLLAACILILASFSLILTHIGLGMTKQESSVIKKNGLNLLSLVPNKKHLKYWCYFPKKDIRQGLFASNAQTDFPTRKIQKIYYQVTGRSCLQTKPSNQILRRAENWRWDPDLGGDDVGGKVNKLSLSASRMDGVVQAQEGLAYFEWTMKFQNFASFNQEARAEIQLPPGGVVSRLTLWIEGEPREAAFGSRSKTKGAYKSIVQRQQDPVLVTTRGPDKIQVQLFPVLPGGKEMKVRIGITAPLWIDNQGEELKLRLPKMIQRNFDIDQKLNHHVWMESKSKLSLAENELSKSLDGDIEKLKISIPQKNMIQSKYASLVIEPQTSTDLEEIIVVQSTKTPTLKIAQKIKRKPSHVDHLVVVLDTSVSNQKFHHTLSTVLKKSISTFNITSLVLSGREGVEVIQQDDLSRFELAKHDFKGGTDNITALLKAMDMATLQPNTGILWLHGPQPVLLSDTELFLQWVARSKIHPLIYAFSLGQGSNKVIQKLESTHIFQSIPQLGTLETDLTMAFEYLMKPDQVYQYSRKAITHAPSNAVTSNSQHVVRLWAFNRIQELLQDRTEKSKTQALKLAMTHQLVTPISGAVVLETQAQYKANDLEPVEAGTVPTIPEPEMWIMLMILLILALLGYRRGWLQPFKQF